MGIDAGDALSPAGGLLGAVNPGFGFGLGLLGSLFSRHKASVPAPPPQSTAPFSPVSALPQPYHDDLTALVGVLDSHVSALGAANQALLAENSMLKAGGAGVPLASAQPTMDAVSQQQISALQAQVAALTKALAVARDPLAQQARSLFPDAAAAVDGSR